MRKKKVLLAILTIIMATMFGLTLVSCGGQDDPQDEEKAPVITVTSANPASIYVGDTYTLAYTVENAKSSNVVASGGTYNAETKQFTADEEGTYTLTITAKNVKKEATKAVTVNVSEAGEGEEKTPVITVTSANPGSITVGDTYTLEYDVENATTTDVVASGGTYDAETKQFTADEEGTYTLTITAKNVVKEATTVVTINVTDKAPKIKFASSIEGLTCTVGETISLPKVTVESEYEYDFIVDLDISVRTGITFEPGSEEGVYELTSSVGGPISVMYLAILKDDPSIESIEVVTVDFETATPETTVAEGEGLGTYSSALAKFNAAQEGETIVFNENFAKGYSSQFITWAGGSEANEAGNPETYLTGAEEAIDGNSFILDYTKIKKTTGKSRIYTGFGNLIRQGSWIIEFDARVISGALNGQAELCVFPQGQNVAYSWKFDIGTQKTHVKIDLGTKRFVDQNSIALLVEAKDGKYTELKIAFDNVRLTYTKLTYPVTEPTGTVARISSDSAWKDMTNGEATFVIDGNNDGYYTQLSGNATPVYLDREQLVKSGILTAEQAAAMTEENGFGDNVIHIFGQYNQLHSLTGVVNLDEFFDDSGNPICEITISMKVIGSSTGWQLLSNGEGMGGSWSGDIVKTYTWTGLADKSFQELGMYNGGIGDLFIGEITVSRIPHIDISVNPDNLLTSLPQWVDNTITLQASDGTLTSIYGPDFKGEAIYVDRSKLVYAGKFTQEEYEKAFSVANGFSEDDSIPVLYLNGSNPVYFSALDGLFDDPDDGYSYKLTYKGWIVNASNWHFWNINNGSSLKQIADGANKALNESLDVVTASNFTKTGFFSLGTIEIYISQIIVERTPVDPGTGPQVGDSYSFDFSDTDVWNHIPEANRVNTADVPELSGVAGFGEKAAHYKRSGTDGDLNAEILDFQCDASVTYRMTLQVYVVKGNPKVSLHAAWLSFIKNFNMTTDTGAQTITVEWTGYSGNDFRIFLSSGDGEVDFYVGNIEIEVIAV